uniref:(northern house mosquito) hypothetical protein n=1 Tax=Culex pipiens TaxID=7175 RepID=A0A8D8FTF1_CULPI
MMRFASWNGTWFTLSAVFRGASGSLQLKIVCSHTLRHILLHRWIWSPTYATSVERLFQAMTIFRLTWIEAIPSKCSDASINLASISPSFCLTSSCTTSRAKVSSCEKHGNVQRTKFRNI